MRMRNKKWGAEELATNEKVAKNPTSYKGKWKEFFGNDNPIYLEIGCGKGRFIIENSKTFENINFIALERIGNIICIAARSARESNAGENLKFLEGDVNDLDTFFDENEIERLYINFCDPWDRRKKWHKKRLTHRAFLNIYRKLLVQNGEIHFKTDNKNLFEASVIEFEETDWELKNITLDLHNSDFRGNIMTEYERKFSGMGMQIFRLEAINNKEIEE